MTHSKYRYTEYCSISADNEACHWFARQCLGEMSPEEREAFEIWRTLDPRHDQAYNAYAKVWEIGGELRGDQDLIPLNQEKSATESLQSTRPLRLTGKVGRMLLPIEAGIALIAGAFFILQNVIDVPARHYVTAIGQQQLVELPDGSTAHLNTDTEIIVDYNDQQRNIELIKGEAVFTVTTDTMRKFNVNVGKRTVTAVGTRFNVHRTHKMLEIAVLEGTVEIFSPETGKQPSSKQRTSGEPSQTPAHQGILHAGQEVIFLSTTDSAKPIVKSIQPERITAWQQGKLYFDNESLDSAIEEINRYLDSKLILGDPELAKLRITGVFKIGDTASLYFALRELVGITVEREDAIVLRRQIH